MHILLKILKITLMLTQDSLVEGMFWGQPNLEEAPVLTTVCWKAAPRQIGASVS